MTAPPFSGDKLPGKMSDGPDELVMLALQARRENRLAEAKQHLAEAVNFRREAGAKVDLAKALTGLGQIERDLGQSEAALQHYQEAAAIYRAEADALRLAHTVRHIGDIHRHEGNVELAEPCYREALFIYRGHAQTAQLDLANAIRGLAILKGEAGATAEAR